MRIKKTPTLNKLTKKKKEKKRLVLRNHIFLNFKMYIFREPVIIQRQMSSFGKNSFSNKNFHSWVMSSFKHGVEYMAWHPQ